MTDGLDMGRKMPVCLRKYDRGNPECDGRPRARTPDERMPCVYRDRCVALQRLIRVKGYKARELLKLRKVQDADRKRRTYAFAVGDSDEFQQRLVRVIDQYGIRNGRVTISHPQDEAPRKRRRIVNRSEESKQKSVRALVKARKFAAKAHKEKARLNMDATSKLLGWFVLRLQRATERELAADQDSAERGQVFLVDRVATRRYVTLYCKVIRRGKKQKKRIIRRPIARIALGVSTHTLQVRFPFDRATLARLMAKSARAKLQPADFAEGHFRSRTGQVDKEGASLAAEVIARACNQGIIRLPKLP